MCRFIAQTYEGILSLGPNNMVRKWFL